MAAPVKNQILMNAEGAMIRVDRVVDGQVYYVAWRVGQECGNPLRKTVDVFMQRCADEGMIVR